MKKIYKIADLIVGNYFDQLSHEQLDELTTWLNENEENKIFVKNLLSENNLQSALEIYKKDKTRNWHIIEKRIKAKRKVRKLYAVMKYAAMLIIPLSFALLLYNQLDENSLNQQASHTIEPGTTKATLILSDNSIIDLNAQNSESFEEFDGTKISKNNKQLQYAQSDLSNEELIEKFNTVKVPRGGEYQLILSDGTKVWLNSETELHYPVSFIKNERIVKLSGEAYFEVARNTKKPFIVSFENEKIEVLGTSFNVKCYKNENYQATLVEGKIKYQNDSDELILTPNKQAEYDQKTNRLLLKEVNSSDYIAWINGRFIFSNQRLETILSSISRWYDTEVIFQDSSLKDIRFTGKLRRYDKIEKILEILEATKKVKIYANNKSLTVNPV